ncbi:MAG: hydrogenase maturation protease [Gammaproteobacteria bacterium]|nr:hydrogenase maturation protease [Gammaproteobacteria bacterium]
MTEHDAPGVAPVVVFATGNESRGDDGLAPALVRRAGLETRAGITLVIDYQLQVEHALELEGRRLALFIDAGQHTPAPFELRPVHPSPRFLHTTHALAPEAVLETAQRLGIALPEAWILCVRGEHFELGESLSERALWHMEAAAAALQAFLAQ